MEEVGYAMHLMRVSDCRTQCLRLSSECLMRGIRRPQYTEEALDALKCVYSCGKQRLLCKRSAQGAPKHSEQTEPLILILSITIAAVHQHHDRARLHLRWGEVYR